MFDSKVKASAFINEIKNEVDTAPDIADETYYRILTETEQLLYSEIIQEITCFAKELDNGVSIPAIDPNHNPVYDYEKFSLSEITPIAGADNVRFEDIYAVYYDSAEARTRLERATPVSGVLFPDTYWKYEDDLFIHPGHWHEMGEESKGQVEVFYFVRPQPKTTEAHHNDNIKLPQEWLPLPAAKLRGEVYKLVNEDTAAAKWLNDYNVLLEQFKQYMTARDPKIGV